MTLQRPELLLLGPAAALLLTLAITAQWRRRARLGRAYGRLAQLRLLPRALQPFPALRTLCLIGASFSLAVAAAGPRPAQPEPPPPPQPLDLAVAVDVSRSMGTPDVAGPRVERAREVVDQIAEALPSARIVLILFADWPYTLVPPTDDPAVVRYFAHSLSADLVLDRDQGTSLTAVLAHASTSLQQRARPQARRAVLVLSDGGAHDPLNQILESASALAGEGTSVWTAGLGTPDGEAVPSPSGPLLDPTGRAVLSRLEEDVLRELASAGGGEYHDVSNDRGLGALLAAFGSAADDADGGGPAPLDAAFWLTLAALPALLLEGTIDAGRGRSGSGTRGGGASA